MTKKVASGRYHKAHSLVVREKAELLYVLGESTLEGVAASMGVAYSTIRRWASAGMWQSKRAAYRRGRENIYKLYAEMSEKALATKDIDDVKAAIELHNMVEAKRYQSLILATSEKLHDLSSQESF